MILAPFEHIPNVFMLCGFQLMKWSFRLFHLTDTLSIGMPLWIVSLQTDEGFNYWPEIKQYDWLWIAIGSCIYSFSPGRWMKEIWCNSNSHKPVTKSRKGKISRNGCSTMKEKHGVWREREGEAMNRIIWLFRSTEIMKNVVCCNSSSFFSSGDGCVCLWYMDWQKSDYSL